MDKETLKIQYTNNLYTIIATKKKLLENDFKIITNLINENIKINDKVFKEEDNQKINTLLEKL